MTNFILHGGEVSKLSAANTEFFELFTSLVRKPVVKIGACYWAKPKNQWSQILQRDSKLIKTQASKKFNLISLANPAELIEKLPTLDVIYVAGGDSYPIEKLYSQLNSLGSKLENKVFIGSSMGAFMAAKNYVLSFDDQDDTEVHQGLGLIPFNILCHWDQETKKSEKIQLLTEADPETQILQLNETEWINIEVD